MLPNCGTPAPDFLCPHAKPRLLSPLTRLLAPAHPPPAPSFTPPRPAPMHPPPCTHPHAPGPCTRPPQNTQELDAPLVSHLSRLGLLPAALVLPWISTAFAGALPVQEVRGVGGWLGGGRGSGVPRGGRLGAAGSAGTGVCRVRRQGMYIGGGVGRPMTRPCYLPTSSHLVSTRLPPPLTTSTTAPHLRLRLQVLLLWDRVLGLDSLLPLPLLAAAILCFRCGGVCMQGGQRRCV